MKSKKISIEIKVKIKKILCCSNFFLSKIFFMTFISQINFLHKSYLYVCHEKAY